MIQGIMTTHKISPYSAPGLKRTKTDLTLMFITERVCNYFGVSVEYCRMKTRKNAPIRMYVYYFAKKHLVINSKPISFDAIGHFFGGKNHASVLNGMKRLKGFIEINDRETMYNIKQLEQEFEIYLL